VVDSTVTPDGSSCRYVDLSQFEVASAQVASPACLTGLTESLSDEHEPSRRKHSQHWETCGGNDSWVSDDAE